MKWTGTPKKVPSTRLPHAVSKSTPSMCVEMSIRTGATPIWYTVSCESLGRQSIVF